MSRRPLREGGRTDVLFTGGGTAGHVLPALALADALVERGHERAALHFVGSRRGMEAVMVPAAGYSQTLLSGRGFLRRMSARNLVSLGALVVAFCQSLVLVARRRPRVIVGVGGYASVPCALAGVCLRVPLLVVNPDAVMGAANRLLARFARIVALGGPGERVERGVVTGVPLREDVLRADCTAAGRERARARFGFEARRVIGIVGGSLGAGSVNEVGLRLARHYAERADLVIYHVCGERNFQAMTARTAELSPSLVEYRLVAFEDRLAELFLSCDVVVARAGAGTVAELAFFGVPSVLIPLPGVPNDHQAKNAASLGSVGAAVVIADDPATPDAVVAALDELLSDPHELASMGARACSVAHGDATERVVVMLEHVAAHKEPVEIGGWT